MQKKLWKSRRKFIASFGALIVGSQLFSYNAISKKNDGDSKSVFAEPLKKHPTTNARLGMNLSGISYWSSEFPFVDFMHQSGEWISQPRKGKWGGGPKLSLDENGWVKKIESGCRVTKVICAGGDISYPSGTYVLLYEGEGEIVLNHEFSQVGVIRKIKQGRLELKIDATKGQMAIDLIQTNPENYLRNIRLIAPGYESRYEHNPWHPDFLAQWSGVSCIRLMDMMGTNNSKQIDWINRPKLSDASYAQKGVPVELLVDLANQLQTDVWLCMPHQANDDYIAQFARVVKQRLKPNLRVWVEYSNEIWNGSFAQYKYASQQGQALKLADNQWTAAFQYNALRSVEIFKIWENVFQSHERLVRVIGSRASDSNFSSQLLQYGSVLSYVDALAIAPYIAMNVPLKAKKEKLFADKVANWSLDKVFKYINNEALPKSNKSIDKSKKVADKYGVRLVAYESGQHLVGIAGAEKNNKLTQLFIRANKDKRMGDVYKNHLKYWQAAGGDLICMYNSVSSWSKWGSWGLLQHINDSKSGTPKFKAVMEWAKSRGQKVNY